MRDRYFDTLRAVAILRVVIFHAFPVAALELAVPSMGVMFALGGSLMAKSIDTSATRAVRNRLRRLLPALWVMSVILVPLMLLRGWSHHPAWPQLLLWILPIADPPSSELGYPAAGVLWYLVTYLWLVLLSPALLALYRQLRMAALMLPLILLAVLVAHPNALGDRIGWVAQNILTFGACWILGFAHREGDLARLKPWTALGLAVACIGGGLGWAATHPGANGVDLTGIPIAYAIFSAGFVLALLRWAPDMGWLSRVRPINGFVTMVNNRAVTIYLWHNVAITVAVMLFDPLQLWKIPHQWIEDVVDFGLALSMLAAVVLALGWVEDVAARRRPRISPFPRRPGPVSTQGVVAAPAARALSSV